MIYLIAYLYVIGCGTAGLLIREREGMGVFSTHDISGFVCAILWPIVMLFILVVEVALALITMWRTLVRPFFKHVFSFRRPI